MRKILFALLICFVAGCTHGGIRLPDLDTPLTELQKAVVDSLPLGKRAVSPNGREFFSEYFVVVQNQARPATRAPMRYYAHVYVLGDRRPYVIEGLVRKQVLEKGGSPEGDYSDSGVDDRLTKVLMRKIKAALSKRREDRNIIDDFRVF
ncbi:MAG: hypothetical protein IT288_12195 [Bdellovibrionales bacterium]|nr:hypothetical protein [Bdellovibrionales bacterium]